VVPPTGGQAPAFAVHAASLAVPQVFIRKLNKIHTLSCNASFKVRLSRHSFFELANTLDRGPGVVGGEHFRRSTI
jgi:hypothetical protein